MVSIFMALQVPNDSSCPEDVLESDPAICEISQPVPSLSQTKELKYTGEGLNSLHMYVMFKMCFLGLVYSRV